MNRLIGFAFYSTMIATMLWTIWMMVFHPVLYLQITVVGGTFLYFMCQTSTIEAPKHITI